MNRFMAADQTIKLAVHEGLQDHKNAQASLIAEKKSEKRKER
jgi:hypothetical protein